MSMSMMSLRGYFYRTWYPGMNSASGVIDPNKAYDCSRRLARLKKWSCWILVISFLIFMLTVIIYNLIPASGVAALNGTSKFSFLFFSGVPGYLIILSI